MGARRPLGFAFLVAAAVLLASAGAAHQTSSSHHDSRTIHLGGEETVTASVSNPLDVPDVLTVDFNGEAVTSGMISVSLPGDEPRVRCSETDNTCRVTLSPGEEKDLQFGIVGEREGTSEFMVHVSSETTGKRGDAGIQVVVEDGDSFMSFLNRLLGIS